VYTPSQIKEIIKDSKLFINKKLGQNFLVDKNKRDQIIRLSDISREDIVLEVGPGLGALTESIQPQVKKFLAIEKDRGLASLLSKKNFNIVNEDILKYDLSNFLKRCREKIKVIGNLPYYITSPIIFCLIEHREKIESIFITVQKEVAERIIAGPGSKNYGILSLSIQYYSNPKILLSLPKSAFFPRPDVDSVFMSLEMLKKPKVDVKNEETFFKIIKASFGKRRKTLLNSLSTVKELGIKKEALKEALLSLGFDEKIRGEALSLNDFAKLTSYLKQ